jgi:hypothetical protein
MRSIRKTIFNEGRRTEGFFRHPSVSKAVPIIVDLRVDRACYFDIKRSLNMPANDGEDHWNGLRRPALR